MQRLQKILHLIQEVYNGRDISTFKLEKSEVKVDLNTEQRHVLFLLIYFDCQDWTKNLHLPKLANIFNLSEAQNEEIQIYFHDITKNKDYSKIRDEIDHLISEYLKIMNLEPIKKSMKSDNVVNAWQNQIRSDVSLSSLWILADIIQQFRYEDQETAQKSIGSYYTPIGIIEYMAERILSPFTSLDQIAAPAGSDDFVTQVKTITNLPPKTYRIMDYACGMGFYLFYLAAFGGSMRFVSLHSNIIFPFPHWEFLGVDKDPIAIAWAKWFQQILSQHPIFGPEMRNVFFIEADMINDLSTDQWHTLQIDTNPTSFQEETIDLVISNPPYVSWGLGRVGKLQKTTEHALRTNFQHSAEYKISLYAIFIERAIQLLKPGGWMSLIIPDSFLAGKYFNKIRLFLLNSTRLKEILLIQKSFWKGAESGHPVILTLQKNPINKNLNSEAKAEPSTLIKAGRYEKGKVEISQTNITDQEHFRTLPKNRFRLLFSPEIAVFVEGMEANSQPLSTWFEMHHGIRARTGIGKARIIANRKMGPMWKPAIISGNCVTPYHIEYQGQFILTNPEMLFSGGFTPWQIEQEKLILRRTGDHLVAAVDPVGVYHPNTLIYLIPKPNTKPPLSLHALCALFNSEPMNRYYQSISMKKDRAMAQVEIDMIEQLPIKINPPLASELDQGSRAVHALRNESIIHTMSPETKTQLTNLLTLIDLTVKLLYFKND